MNSSHRMNPGFGISGMFLRTLLLLLASHTAAYDETIYNGDKVYRVELDSKSHVKLAADFYKHTWHVLDYWAVDLHIGGYLDFRITPEQDQYLELLGTDLPLTVRIENVGELLHQQAVTARSRTRRDTSYSYGRYNSAASTIRELNRLSEEYDNLTTLVTVGASHQGRPLIVMEISGTGDKKDKPLVWVDAGIHAREWITVASTMFFLRELLEGYGADNRTTQLLNENTFAIMPLANPDGYAYSWNSERLWRKNRSPTPVLWCKGVDLNRNFDVNFGGHGSSDFSCSEIYSGPNAFSENESHGIAKYLSAVRHDILAYFSLHSYGQMWLTPLSYTRRKVSDRSHHLGVAEFATKSIKSQTGHKYTYGPATSLMYLTSGDSSDWVYAELNCSHAYGIELSDNGRHGFLLPDSHIPAVGRDVHTGVLAAVDYITSDQHESDHVTTDHVRKRQRRPKKRGGNKERGWGGAQNG